jgi:UrcA family protein
MELAMTKFFVLALLAAASVPATAANTSAVAVQTSDLNLANPAGVATLDRRLTAAASQVCSGSDGSLTQNRAAAACRADVLSKAQPARNAKVATYHSMTVALSTSR